MFPTIKQFLGHRTPSRRRWSMTIITILLSFIMVHSDSHINGNGRLILVAGAAETDEEDDEQVLRHDVEDSEVRHHQSTVADDDDSGDEVGDNLTVREGEEATGNEKIGLQTSTGEDGLQGAQQAVHQDHDDRSDEPHRQESMNSNEENSVHSDERPQTNVQPDTHSGDGGETEVDRTRDEIACTGDGDVDVTSEESNKNGDITDGTGGIDDGNGIMHSGLTGREGEAGLSEGFVEKGGFILEINDESVDVVTDTSSDHREKHLSDNENMESTDDFTPDDIPREFTFEVNDGSVDVHTETPPGDNEKHSYDGNVETTDDNTPDDTVTVEGDEATNAGDRRWESHNEANLERKEIFFVEEETNVKENNENEAIDAQMASGGQEEPVSVDENWESVRAATMDQPTKEDTGGRRIHYPDERLQGIEQPELARVIGAIFREYVKLAKNQDYAKEDVADRLKQLLKSVAPSRELSEEQRDELITWIEKRRVHWPFDIVLQEIPGENLRRFIQSDDIFQVVEMHIADPPNQTDEMNRVDIIEVVDSIPDVNKMGLDPQVKGKNWRFPPLDPPFQFFNTSLGLPVPLPASHPREAEFIVAHAVLKRNGVNIGEDVSGSTEQSDTELDPSNLGGRQFVSNQEIHIPKSIEEFQSQIESNFNPFYPIVAFSLDSFDRGMDGSTQSISLDNALEILVDIAVEGHVAARFVLAQIWLLAPRNIITPEKLERIDKRLQEKSNYWPYSRYAWQWGWHFERAKHLMKNMDLDAQQVSIDEYNELLSNIKNMQPFTNEKVMPLRLRSLPDAVRLLSGALYDADVQLQPLSFTLEPGKVGFNQNNRQCLMKPFACFGGTGRDWNHALSTILQRISDGEADKGDFNYTEAYLSSCFRKAEDGLEYFVNWKDYGVGGHVTGRVSENFIGGSLHTYVERDVLSHFGMRSLTMAHRKGHTMLVLMQQSRFAAPIYKNVKDSSFVESLFPYLYVWSSELELDNTTVFRVASQPFAEPKTDNIESASQFLSSVNNFSITQQAQNTLLWLANVNEGIAGMAVAYGYLSGYGGWLNNHMRAAQRYLEVATPTVKNSEAGLVHAGESSQFSDMLDDSLADTPQETKNAISYYEMMAEDGDPEAAEALGEIYINGDPERAVERNLPRARDYFGRAAAAGIPEGHANLAMMYINGLGEDDAVAAQEQDEQRFSKRYNVTGALHHYEIAAKSGNGAALNGLGYIYLLGEGDVQPNRTLAKYYFQRASDAGIIAARSNLAVIYMEEGEEQNFTKARELLEQTVVYPDAVLDAFYNLGLMRFYGWGHEDLSSDDKAKYAAQMFKHVADSGYWKLDNLLRPSFALGLFSEGKNTLYPPFGSSYTNNGGIDPTCKLYSFGSELENLGCDTIDDKKVVLAKQPEIFCSKLVTWIPLESIQPLFLRTCTVFGHFLVSSLRKINSIITPILDGQIDTSTLTEREGNYRNQEHRWDVALRQTALMAQMGISVAQSNTAFLLERGIGYETFVAPFKKLPPQHAAQKASRARLAEVDRLYSMIDTLTFDNFVNASFEKMQSTHLLTYLEALTVFNFRLFASEVKLSVAETDEFEARLMSLLSMDPEYHFYFLNNCDVDTADTSVWQNSGPLSIPFVGQRYQWEAWSNRLAVEMYDISADQNNRDGLLRLGQCCLDGIELNDSKRIEESDRFAPSLFRNVSSFGYVLEEISWKEPHDQWKHSMVRPFSGFYGSCQLDVEEAIGFLNESLTLGSAEAGYHLADLYSSSLSTVIPRNYTMAMKYVNQAEDLTGNVVGPLTFRKMQLVYRWLFHMSEAHNISFIRCLGWTLRDLFQQLTAPSLISHCVSENNKSVDLGHVGKSAKILSLNISSVADELSVGPFPTNKQAVCYVVSCMVIVWVAVLVSCFLISCGILWLFCVSCFGRAPS